MREGEPGAELVELWREIRDVAAAEALLAWDQETYMPKGGLAGRASSLATLAGIKHGLLTSVRLSECLERCAEAAEPGGELEAQVRRARHHVDRAVRVPAELSRALAETSSLALAAWQEAREAASFETFRPILERMIDLKRQEAVAISPGGNVYDVLLDEHDPGATEEDLAPLFSELRERLAPIVAAVEASGVTVDESPALGHFDVAAQEAFGREISRAIGFDFSSGRLDTSAHPFCTGIGRTDVRMTWRSQEDDFRPALYGIVHESGHGLYEQGLPEEWNGSPLGEAVSLGIHESQSRLWENQVGRSHAFWRWALPRFQEHFPGTGTVSVETIWPTLHVVRPSLIRVEADEVTYNLHVAIRFEIERAIFAGEIEVGDLPERWNALYEELLGIHPPDDSVGVLQDIHWALGAFGYFHTYTLGTLAAAQLFDAADRELSDLEGSIAAGDFAPLLEWLRAAIHRQASRYEAAELIERATGAPLSPEPFLAQVGRDVDAVYGV